MGGGKRIKGVFQKTKTVLKIGPSEEKKEMDEIERKIKQAEAEYNRQQVLKEEEELRKLHQPDVDESDKPKPIEKIEIAKIVTEEPKTAAAATADAPSSGEKKDIKGILQGIQQDKELEEKDKKEEKLLIETGMLKPTWEYSS